MIGNGRIRALNTPIRRIEAGIEIYDSDKAYIDYLTNRDKVKSFTIERVGEEGKFFGFGICQKLNLHLTSLDYKLTTDNILKTSVWDTENYGFIYPEFNITEVHKNENNGELSITAYDAIHKAAEHTINELNSTATTITEFAEEIAYFLGCYGMTFFGSGSVDCFNVIYDETALANFEGTETIRDVLDDMAEATQTIYYINYDNYLVFKRLDKDGIAMLTIGKEDYITLDSGDNRRLTKLISATELGDNLEATLRGTASGEAITIDDVSPVEHNVEVKVENRNIVKSFAIEAVATQYTNALFIECDLKPATTYTISFVAAAGYRFYLNEFIVAGNKKTTGTGERQSITFTTKSTLENDYRYYVEGKGWIIAKNDVDNSIIPNFSSVQLEKGAKATDYVAYTAPEDIIVNVHVIDDEDGIDFTPEADGTVLGITSLSPTMKFRTNRSGIILTVNYERNNTISGSTQYVRNNALWDLRADRTTLIDNALANIWGLTINQFDMEWRGNYVLEIGDKIDFITKDNTVATSYVLNDVIEYNGGFKERTQWHYTESEETAANPSNLGDLLKQTYTKVDKVNKEVEIVVSQVEGVGQTVNQLLIDTQQIRASVTEVEKTTNDNVNDINGAIDTLTSRVDAVITAEDVKLSISQELEKGVNKVTTSTGYTFNEEGLTVDKSGSEMKTTISDDGMRVFRNNHEVLTADNTGVKAENLHATTYLIIGNNSRFEDYGGRTGCFWIG